MNTQIQILFFLFFSSSLIAQSFEHLPIKGTKSNGSEMVAAFAGGMDRPQYSEVDLDNDGEKDLYVFDRIGNVHLTFLKEKIGDEIKYRFEPRFAKNFPKCTSWVLLRDFDGDGIEDLFTYAGLELINGVRVFQGKYSNGKIDFERVDVNQGLPSNVLTFDNNNSFTEIYVSSLDYPAINDIDNDGDLDILTYDQLGVHVHYYQNQAIENDLPLDNFPFIIEDDCWGRFSENLFGSLYTLGSNIDDCPEWTNPNIHPGSTLLPFDEDGDGLLEILIGDNSNAHLAKLINGGTSETAFMIEIDTTFPNYDVPTDIDFFVASFLLDVDDDDLKDLIVAPNWLGISENYHVSWFYKNIGTHQNFVFEYQQSDWLIEDIFDFGSQSAPTVVDVNADGLLDIVVGNQSFYISPLEKDPRLILLENVGTETEPNFKMSDDNWLNFKQFDNYTTGFTPAFGDIDNDGDEDLFVGERFGSLFFVENIGGAGNPMEFDIITHHFQDIDIGQASAPQIIDLNKDGLPDLLIGDRFGDLTFFPNIGTPQSPQFHPEKGEAPNIAKFGEITTAPPNSQFGNASPSIIETGSSFALVTGAESGNIDLYQFSSNQIYDLIPPTVTNWGGIKVGLYSKPAIADLNVDGILDLIVGNQRGGLSVFESHLGIDGTTSINEGSNEDVFHIYPNPATDCLYVERKNDFNQTYKIVVLNVAGGIEFEALTPKIDVSELGTGIYYLKIGDEYYKFVKI